MLLGLKKPHELALYILCQDRRLGRAVLEIFADASEGTEMLDRVYIYERETQTTATVSHPALQTANSDCVDASQTRSQAHPCNSAGADLGSELRVLSEKAGGPSSVPALTG